MSKKVFLSLYPTFDCVHEYIKNQEFEVVFNPYQQKLNKEVIKWILLRHQPHGIIAGTETYDEDLLKHATNLEVISRVGAGYDSVNIDYCKSRNIQVTYTPYAPVQSVAELTVCQILSLLRGTHKADSNIRKGYWQKLMGNLIEAVPIGIIGFGRIGSKVAELLQPFNPKIYSYDIDKEKEFSMKALGVTPVTLHELLELSQTVTMHIPMNTDNYKFVNKEFLSSMNLFSYFINTSRGPIVDEKELCKALDSGKLAGAALDVFSEEPYIGPLTEYDNVLLTSHMGAATKQGRLRMEKEAAQECVSVLNNANPKNPLWR